MKTGTIEEREVDKRKDVHLLLKNWQKNVFWGKLMKFCYVRINNEPQYKEIIVYKKSIKKKRSW